MIYPTIFCTAELIKKDSEELQSLLDALWADYMRVMNARKVVTAMEGEE